MLCRSHRNVDRNGDVWSDTMFRKHAPGYWILAVTLATSIVLTAPAEAQEPAQPSIETLNARAMQLLREGQSKEAAAAAEEALGLVTADAISRCEALFYLASAKWRLKDPEAADAAMGRLTEALRDVGPVHWLPREAEVLRGEMRGLSRAEAQRAADAAAQKAPPPAAEIQDIGSALWQMRYANSQGEWAQAVQWGERILGHPAASDAGVAGDALLHLYFAQRKLERKDDSGATLVRFTEVSPRFPAESTLGIEMALLRRSLGEDAVVAQGQSFRPEPEPYWGRAEPAEAGMDAAPLREHEELCRLSGADGVLVARGGKIVSEWYSPLYREPIHTMSSVKSITGILAGLLVADGKLKVGDLVGNYVPQWQEGPAGRATLEHLLTMTSGLPKLRTGGLGSPDHRARSMNELVTGLRPSREPGERWEYSNEGAQLLSPVLERAAGMPLHQYAKERLFAPMSLRHTELARDSAGSTNTYADAATTLREMAKVGELVLQRGRWEGEQLVPAAWIEQMLRPCPQKAGYGYLWWLYQEPARVVAMEGYLNTSVWVFPELDLVVARAQKRAYLHAPEQYDPQRMMALMVRAAAKPVPGR
jgi:hypothetical protein